VYDSNVLIVAVQTDYEKSPLALSTLTTTITLPSNGDTPP
jgi:hypothetical protein